MRMTASWSGSKRTDRIQVCGANRDAPQWRAPLGSSRRSKKGPSPVHRPSACSGVKALRNTSAASRQSRQAVRAFRSLDPFRALREPDCRRRDEKRPFPLRTKNFSITQNNRLTGKAPYKFESSPLQRTVRVSRDIHLLRRKAGLFPRCAGRSRRAVARDGRGAVIWR